MPRQTLENGKQAITPENRYILKIFIESDLIYSHQVNWGWVQTIFSFRGMDLQKIIEMHYYILHVPCMLGNTSYSIIWQFVV